MKKILLLVLLSCLAVTCAFAQPSFVVRNIEIRGLQNISAATVETYLPIKRGQELRPAKTAAVLRALYKTGFFDHISLSKQGSTLVISVTERPTIGQLKITGNSVLPTDKLTSVMKTLDIAEGRVYNPAVLEKIKQSLLNQYYLLGRYNARVDVTTTPMSRNRVIVHIAISEGLVAKIRRISIIGNHVFSESTLVKQLDISTTGLFTFFTQKDRYSEEKLEASLDKLRGYYMDHGYLRFEIKSSQAEVTPDRKSVYITVVISEGQPYTVQGYELTGRLILPRSTYEQRITIKPGQLFSRSRVIEAEKSITSLLGDQGFLFANVSVRPKVNDETRNVILIFDINPRKRAYVRHVTFSDNTRTNDEVLRREIEQMEAAPASNSKLEESKQRLSLLPYIKNVDMAINPVPEIDDQVDVDYKVKEDNSAQASFKIGYSQVYRVILGAGFNQKNFFGTGNTLGINLSHSKYEQSYGIDYTNPYYTPDGISRTFNFAITRMDYAGAGVNTGYTTNEYDLGVLYGIPLGQEPGVFTRLQAGVGYQNTRIRLVPPYISTQLNNFVTSHGTHYQEMDFKLGLSRDSRDRAMMATRGTLQTLFLNVYAPLSHGSVAFYTMDYSGKWYQPLTEQFIVLSMLNLGYGNGFHGVKDYPFFRNYFAGGIGSVRGYEGYTLGPRDSKGNPFGGNMLATASINLIFPNYISDNLRTSIFVDAGNVYSALNDRNFGGNSTNSGPIRYSTGLEADLLTPFGPIGLSVAQPLNLHRPPDQRQTFQFALGANF